MTKTQLQEQALQLEASIYYPEGHEKAGKELTNADLEDVIDEARTAALKAHEDEQAEADRIRQDIANKAKSGSDGEDGEDGEDIVVPADEPDPEPDPAPVAAPKKTRTARAGLVRDPNTDRLKRMGTTVSDKDRKLAKKHGYPVAIPGGKAYKTAIRINCVYGAGTRQPGSVVLLDDSQAQHKAEWLTPVR